MGFEARYVVDFTDHVHLFSFTDPSHLQVWTEIYIPSLKKYVHTDPCENAFNTPLVYEQGWGKQLNYIFAFGVYQVLDVTLRYTRDPMGVYGRRKDVQESWLREVIEQLNNDMRKTLSAQYREELKGDDGKEWEEMVSECKIERVENLPGRITGSLEWRSARGELGAGKDESDVIPKYFGILFCFLV